MCPEPAELRSIGDLTESISTPKSKSNTLIPKNQLAAILTKGSFTREEWNHLLHLFNLMNISVFSSSHFSPSSYPQTMSKSLIQEDKPGEDERVVAKPKPARNPVSKTVNWSPAVLSSSTSQSSGKRTAESSSFDSVGTVKPVAISSFSSEATRCKSELQHRDSCCENDKEFHWYKFHHNLDSSPSNVEYVQKAHSHVRRKLSRPQNDKVQINLNAMTWGIYLSATRKAAVHLGKDREEKLRTTKITDVDKIKPRLLGYNVMGEKYFVERQSCQAIDSKRKRFSDSVLCLGGRIAEYPQSVVSWKDRIDWFMQSPQYREDTIDGEPVVFEWKHFPRAHHAEAAPGGPRHDGNIAFSPKDSKVESSSRRCTTTSIRDKKSCIRRKVSSRTLVIPRTWISRTMVPYAPSQTNWFEEQSS